MLLEEDPEGLIGFGRILEDSEDADAVDVGACRAGEAFAGFPGSFYAVGIGVGRSGEVRGMYMLVLLNQGEIDVGTLPKGDVVMKGDGKRKSRRYIDGEKLVNR